MIQEKSCGCIVIKNNRVLVVEHNQGHIGFPKGHVEANESEEETAIREVKEETGIDVKVDKTHRYTVHYSPRENVEKEVVFFLGEEVGGELSPQFSEVAAAYYMPIDEALTKVNYKSVQEVLKEALSDIKNKSIL